MNKGLIILRGESFRLGGQGTRNIGSDESVHTQEIASRSHKKFIEYIESKFNFSIDLCIGTQSTKYDDLLLGIYSGINIVKTSFYTNYLDSQNDSIQRVINTILDDIEIYDFLLVLRCDLILNDNFFDLFDPFTDKLMFPFVCWYHDRKTFDGDPRMSDMFFYIPKKYFILCKNINQIPRYHSVHDSISYWKNIITDLNYGVYLDTYHDSDSAKDWNPIYCLAGRNCKNENQMVSNINLKFPENF